MAAASNDAAERLAIVIPLMREDARQLAALKQDISKERKLRIDAEARESKLLAAAPPPEEPHAAAEAITGEQLARNVINALENLNANYAAIQTQCNGDSDMAEASRLRITAFVQASAADRIRELTAATKAQADYLRQQSVLHRNRAAILRETRDLAESQLCQAHNTSIELMKNPNLNRDEAAHVISDVQAAIQAATLKLKIVARRVSFPLYTEDNMSEASDYKDYRSRLDSTNFLGLPKIVKDFRTIVEILGEMDDAKIVKSIREQNRIEKLSSWNAQKNARVATLATKTALQQTAIAKAKEAKYIRNFERVGRRCNNLAQKLQKCHQRGDEWRSEIIKLQDQLRIARTALNTSNISAPTPEPGRPQIRSQPFTKEEAHELDKFLKHYTQNSSQYHSIIKDLEQRLTYLAQGTAGAPGSESDQIRKLRDKISTLISNMREKEKRCEDQKKDLKDQIENLVKQSALVDTYAAEIARLNAVINGGNSNIVQTEGETGFDRQVQASNAELAAKLSQYEGEISRLNTEGGEQRAEIVRLENQNIGQGMRAQGREQDQLTITHLQAERTEFRTQRNALQAQLDNVQGEHRKAKEQLQALATEKKVDEAEKKKLMKQLGEHETNVARLAKELGDTKEKLKISEQKLKDCLKEKNAMPPASPPLPVRTPTPPEPTPSPPPAPKKRRRNPGSRLLAEIAGNNKLAKGWGYLP